MRKEQIVNLFNEFLLNYNEEEKDLAWDQISLEYLDFWNKKIFNTEFGELNDQELDDIIKYLDSQARGNNRESFAVGRAMIPQGMWRRMLNDIHGTKELREIFEKLFKAETDTEKINLINELYIINKDRRNSLTGKSGNAINSLLFVSDPKSYTSVLSLNHRKSLIDFFEFEGGPNFENNDQGTKIIKSNKAIIEGFKKLGFSNSIRTIDRFLYSPLFKNIWLSKDVLKAKDEELIPDAEGKPIDEELSLFYLESHLEDFLIENWERTELGRKYDLLEKDGEIISSQYKTGIGKIDILAKDKKTGQFVVIELKKNQTSDDTIGQIARYMGWLEAEETNGEPTKGIIIAAQYDRRLNYALKKVKDVEVYLYRVNFQLDEFLEK